MSFCQQSSAVFISYRRSRWVPHCCAQGRATEGNWAHKGDAHSHFQISVSGSYPTRGRNRHSHSARSFDTEGVASTSRNALLEVDAAFMLLFVLQQQQQFTFN
jgi:hypothetical protein